MQQENENRINEARQLSNIEKIEDWLRHAESLYELKKRSLEIPVGLIGDILLAIEFLTQEIKEIKNNQEAK